MILLGAIRLPNNTFKGNAGTEVTSDILFFLCSLENLDEHGALKSKADLFTKRTIRAQQAVEHVDTAAEALAVSIGEKARVDLAYMEKLTGKAQDTLISDLQGVIFQDPQDEGQWLPADEYLSGNVREKLAVVNGMMDDPDYMVKYIHLEPMKRDSLQETLRMLGREETPEYYTAQATSKALLFAITFIWVPLFSIPLGIGLVGLTAFAIYTTETKRVQKELMERRQLIERELPQFASTIAQSLNTTRDVVSILSSYRRICGVTLATEIDKTLNDIMTGNAGQAIKALEGRVSSPKLAQLTRGLQAVLRGDDQRIYFDLLAAEYRKSQDEEIKKILLNRPKELYPFLGVLFFTLSLMIAASLGADMVNQMGNFG